MIPFIYGTSIVCVLHVLQWLRKVYPGKHILIIKTDIQKSYHRMHTYGGISAACIAIIGELYHVLTRLPFGSTPAQSKLCVL